MILWKWSDPEAFIVTYVLNVSHFFLALIMIFLSYSDLPWSTLHTKAYLKTFSCFNFWNDHGIGNFRFMGCLWFTRSQKTRSNSEFVFVAFVDWTCCYTIIRVAGTIQTYGEKNKSTIYNIESIKKCFKFLVVGRFLLIFISDYTTTTTGKCYALSHLFWGNWICFGNCCCFNGFKWKGYFQAVSNTKALLTIEGSMKYDILFFRKVEYPNLPNEAMLINTIGILIVLFAGIVIYLATNRNFRRQPLPEDAILLTGHNE